MPAEREVGAWDRLVELTNRGGDRLLKRVNRAIARQSALPVQPFYEPSDFPWVAPLETDWKKIRTELDALLAFIDALPELPGHQHRPVQPHRRRPLEDVLLLRLRLPQRRQLRAVSGDDAPGRGGPRAWRPRCSPSSPRGSASRRTTAPTRVCCATTSAWWYRTRRSSRWASAWVTRSAPGPKAPASSSTTPTSTKPGTTPTRPASCCSSTSCGHCASRCGRSTPP